MNKIELFYGIGIGFLVCLLGSYLFIVLYTEYNFSAGIVILKSQGQIGKLITLGSILNIFTFALFLKLKKDLIAKGILFSVMLAAIATLFI